MKGLKGIAFWVFTFFCCLLGKNLPIIDMDDSNIELMQEEVKCPWDLTLYSPSNVEEQCITAALICFSTELGETAKEECEDPQKRIIPAVEFLKRLIQERSGNVLKNASECVCESWPQTSFSQFLADMESFLQSQNAAAMSRKLQSNNTSGSAVPRNTTGSVRQTFHNAENQLNT